jgi:hypothetical protein
MSTQTNIKIKPKKAINKKIKENSLSLFDKRKQNKKEDINLNFSSESKKKQM